MAADDYVRARPRWSPDGTRLAYSREHPPRTGRSMVLLPLGGDEQVLTSTLYGISAIDWSADGTRVLSVGRGSPAESSAIWLLPVAAAPRAETQRRVLASRPGYNLWEPRFSPDERWICFLATSVKDTAVHTIHVMPAGGGDWIPITETKYYDDKPRWSPDGKTLYFMSPRRGSFDLWGIGFDPQEGKKVGEPFLVKPFDNPGQHVSQNLGLGHLALSAQRFVLPLAQVSGNIWVLENVDR